MDLNEQKLTWRALVKLAAPVVLAVAGLWFLIPDQKTMLERLVQDGHANRALNLISSLPAQTRAEHPALFSLIEFRLQREQLFPAQQRLLEAHLERVLRATVETDFHEEFVEEMFATLKLTTNAIVVTGMIRPVVGEMPLDVRRALTPELVRISLAAAEPLLGAEIFEEFMADVEMTDQQWSEAVRLWRLAGRPEQALLMIEQRQGAFPGERGAFLTVLEAELLRELGENTKAYRLLKSHLDETFKRVGNIQKDHLELLMALAMETGDELELLPLYDEYVRLNPGAEKVWVRLAELSAFRKDWSRSLSAYQRAIELNPGEITYKRRLAQFYEWNDQPGRAFTLYLACAHAADPFAVDRLVALNPGLYRTPELADVLQGIVPIPGRPDLTLQLARVSVDLGEYEKAKASFEAYLEEKEDPSVYAELGELNLILLQFEQGLASFQKAAALAEDPTPHQYRVAQCLSLLNRYEESFAIYELLSEKTDQVEVLDEYLRFAEALGRYDKVSDAILRKVHLGHPVGQDELVKLDFSLQTQGKANEQLPLLERGLESFPENDIMRQQLALLLARQTKYREAQQILALHKRLKQERSVLVMYLDLMIANNDFARAFEFISGGIEPYLNDDKDVRLRIGHIYANLRKFREAEDVYRKLHEEFPENGIYALYLAIMVGTLQDFTDAMAIATPYLVNPTPEVLELAAKMAVVVEDYAKAEEYQIQYMQRMERPSHYEFGYLGDIRHSRGDRRGAAGAYEWALRLLIARHIAPAEKQEP